ncbi:pyridoxal-phosphate dependent enzyme [Rhodococcus sp. YH1]|uniref:pyridoxal-phosphate dependent enzyme n=1 Tax=Rhodococcus sp. YH1 TaxID=89066 RepID=UPI001386AAD5|nr:putative cystathionine beta-synthase [Rhodococcus sp. YH1]
MTIVDRTEADTADLGVYDSIADVVGNTPLVRLNRITEGIPAAVYAKLEFLNPGGSVKDRAALAMIRAAEESGALQPGGTVVEGTSGNTGVGLAVIAAALGYRSVVVVPDKTSAEKIALLRAHGAQVHVTPGGRPSHHPEFVRNVATRLAAEIPGGWLAGQYNNPANPAAHHSTTGPEIWRQTRGRITHFVAGIGTGGTITGAGQFLAEVSAGAVTVVGADPETSVYGGGDGRAWYVESVGHFLHPQTAVDEWPDSYRPDVVDLIERIPDAEALTVIHRLAREEGLLVGGSAGAAVAAALRVGRTLGPDDVVVVIVPDSGRAYLSKYFDDDWLGRLGFPLYHGTEGVTVVETLPSRGNTPRSVPSTATVSQARDVLADAPALPVVLARPASGPTVVAEILGSVSSRALAGAAGDDPIDSRLEPPLPVVGITEPSVAAARRIAGHRGPVVVAENGHAVALVDADTIRASVDTGPQTARRRREMQ